jgi:uncharacterized protein with FMN-binding domain
VKPAHPEDPAESSHHTDMAASHADEASHAPMTEPVAKHEPVQAAAAAVGVPARAFPPAEAPPVSADATSPTSPSAAPAAPATKAVWKDGTFSGWGTSRHGDIEATVVIEGGRITSATITQCLTRYSCQWIAHLQGQVVTRQSADVDYVSGATQSTDAFYYAVVDALSKAR